MSNTQVGTIFSQIISDVVESSRVDFEEGGVDEHVLDELRQVWPFYLLLMLELRSQKFGFHCISSPHYSWDI